MSTVNQTYSLTYDLSIECSQADHELLSRIFETATINGECWEAAGHRNKNSGYVHLSLSNAYKIHYVHRFVCHLFHNLPLDHKTHECHHLCRNKTCCRPSHLVPVSITDHKAKTHADGCHSRGENAPWAILTDDQVRSLRLRYAKGETCPALAREAGIKRTTLWNAIHGVSFDHIPGAVTPNDRRDNSGERHHRARLKKSDIPAICTAYWAGGLSMLALGRIYGISDETIRAIIHGKSWKHVQRPTFKQAA